MSTSPLAIRENVPLAPHTTIGLGGAARYYAHCSSDEEIAEALAHARARGLRVHLLGGGSNTIFSDRGFDGLVIRIATKGVTYSSRGAKTLVAAAAGEEWDPVVQSCVARGLGGVECLSGIPGLVGATPIQNVGAYGQEVADSILSVTAIDRESLQVVTLSEAECEFGYRASRFKGRERERFVVTGVTFSLPAQARPSILYPELRKAVDASADLASLPDGAPALAAVRESVLKLRRGKGMVVDAADPHSRSVGSFFMNPLLSPAETAALNARCERASGIGSPPTFGAGEKTKIPAAWLVEKAGFPKGTRRGGVGVSSLHALALVNYGGSSRDLLALAAEIESAVLARFGVRLQREPVVVE